MQLDDVLKLNDAQIRTAQAESGLAAAAVDIAGRVIQNKLQEQAVVRAVLENVAKALDIQWDAQAHASLLRAKTAAMQKANRAQSDRSEMELRINRVSALLAGGADWTAIRNGWIALNYVRSHCPPKAVIAAGRVPIPAEASDREGWAHPYRGVPPIEQGSPGILTWAQKHTCFPRLGTAAWDYLASYCGAFADAAATEAATLNARATAAEQLSLELSKIDWERLSR